jgi:hypothetical protein
MSCEHMDVDFSLELHKQEARQGTLIVNYTVHKEGTEIVNRP